MRVLILGGYGVFGARLSTLLVRDGHEVIVAGSRLAKAEHLAGPLGCSALRLRLPEDLGKIADTGADVVVDASGPFQAYSDDPYRVPKACIAAGIHYLDLSDSAEFTGGITALNADAERAGVRVISGASSVPGVSSSVVQALAEGLDRVSVIDAAILPGNRAPRGRSVMVSILGGAGAPLKLWRGGAWRDTRGWSLPRRFHLDETTSRSGYVVDVPDLTLFPKHFGARSVLFRAGLELGWMNRALAALGWLRRWVPVPLGPRAIGVAHWVAQRFEGFGTDRGGMVVNVVGSRAGALVERRWRLVVEAGDGPYIPAIMVRAALRDLEALPVGARACLAEVPLGAIAAAMADLEARVSRSEERFEPLFARILGDRFGDLARAVQDLHAIIDLETFRGEASVTRGTHPLVRPIAAIFGFPPERAVVPVAVTMTREGDREVWQRDFDGQRFRSVLTMGAPGMMRERFGPFSFEIALEVKDGALGFPVRRGWFLGLPLPQFLLPKSVSEERAVDGRFAFDVSLHAPLGIGLVVRYRGWLRQSGEV